MKKLGQKNLKLLLIMGLVFSTSLTYAQDYDDFEYVDSDQLDIDGDFNRKRDFAKGRKRLEGRTNDMVDKKIEDIRLKHEKALQSDLGQIFNGNSQGSQQRPEKKEEPKQEPPKAVVIIEKPTPPVEKEKLFKILPYAGVQMVKTDSTDTLYGEDLNSKVNMGLRFEALVNKYMALGLGVNYSKTEINYSDQSCIGGGFGGCTNSYNVYDPYINPYNSLGGQLPVTTIDASRLALEATGRFFILAGRRVKPYLGAGIGLARTKISYGDNDSSSYSPYGISYRQDDDYTSTSVFGSGAIGLDFLFNESVGLNFDIRHSMTIDADGGSDRPRRQFYTDFDDNFLESVGKQFEDATYTSITLGLVVEF